MIRISPKSKFSWSYDVARADVSIGSLDLVRLRRRGTFNIGAQRFDLMPDGPLGPLALHKDGRIIARAKRAAAFQARYRILADDRHLELRGGLLLRNAVLTHGDVVVATMRRPKYFQRALEIELLQNAPLPLIVFASAVIILYWRAASHAG